MATNTALETAQAGVIKQLRKALFDAAQNHHSHEVFLKYGWSYSYSTPHDGAWFQRCPARECQAAIKLITAVRAYDPSVTYHAPRSKRRKKEVSK